LGAIYEADFLDCSYGYRPGRSARDAVRDLSLGLTIGKFGYLVEADIRGFFEHMDHEALVQFGCRPKRLIKKQVKDCRGICEA
jgi:retron-type reverse transcriptase